MHRSNTVYKRKIIQNYLVDFDVRGQQGMDFFTGGNVIMDYVFWREVTV